MLRLSNWGKAMPIPNHGNLTRGHIKLEVMRLLAKGEMTQKAIADRYGVAQPSVFEFKERYAAEIQAIRDAARDKANEEFAGLWVAEKGARISEYQHQIDRIAEKAEAADWKLSPEWIKAAQTALRSVAEELGDLQKSQVTLNGTVHYTVEGVDPEALK